MYKWIVLFLALLVSSAAYAEVIETDSTTRSTITTNGEMTTTVKSPPPSAISPQLGANSNSQIYVLLVLQVRCTDTDFRYICWYNIHRR
jgi:hypothetical protein